MTSSQLQPISLARQESIPVTIYIFLDLLKHSFISGSKQVTESPLFLQPLAHRLLVPGLVIDCHDTVFYFIERPETSGYCQTHQVYGSAGSKRHPNRQGASTLINAGPSTAKAFSTFLMKSFQLLGEAWAAYGMWCAAITSVRSFRICFLPVGMADPAGLVVVDAPFGSRWNAVFRIHIRLVIVANIDHVMSSLHSAGQRL